MKKGLIDFAIAIMAAFTYLHYNPNTFDIALFSKTVTLNPVIYGLLIVILVWVSINVTNCSDGVDGLCGTLSAVTITSAYVLFKVFEIEPYFRHTILLMTVCILGYLWFNASPSKLLMGDAGSRAIGLFIAFTFLKLHHPLLYIPMAIMLILDGGLGLIKVSFMRFLHINLFKNLRTPIPHEKETGMVRRTGCIPLHNYTARHLYRMYICNNVIYIDFSFMSVV